MNTVQVFGDYLREHGRPLSEINPGSDEYALSVHCAFQAISLAEDARLPILGGDVLSESHGNLVYAYQLWGDKYHMLSWSCSALSTESKGAYLTRSILVARESVNRADEVALQLGQTCYIVLVV